MNREIIERLARVSRRLESRRAPVTEATEHDLGNGMKLEISQGRGGWAVYLVGKGGQKLPLSIGAPSSEAEAIKNAKEFLQHIASKSHSLK
jgi:hypothetical protein